MLRCESDGRYARLLDRGVRPELGRMRDGRELSIDELLLDLRR
jgi:hypothetical protein